MTSSFHKNEIAIEFPHRVRWKNDAGGWEVGTAGHLLVSEGIQWMLCRKYYSGDIVYVRSSILEICSEPHAEV